MAQPWSRALFAIDSRTISTALFFRVAIAVAVPLFGFVLAGHPQAGVAGGATAMFVTMSDIGVTRRARAGTMAAVTLAILAGGIAGDRFGGTTWTDEALIVASALVAGWVSNSHPGISAIARFGALATAAGAGMQVPDPLAAVAVIAGGASAILVAYGLWLVRDVPPDENFIDWREGVRRAFAGADAGWWFAVCYACACAVALLAAEQLRLYSPYWATFVVVMVMRREGTVSLQLVLLYMLGTLAGVPVAALLAQFSIGYLIAHAALATFAAACARLGFALNPALGYLAFTVFLIMIVELARGDDVPPLTLVATRLYDVGVGCAIALVATLIATLGHRWVLSGPANPDR
jgi:hypothetical protein